MRKLFGWAIVVGVIIVGLCYFRGVFNPPVSITFRESLLSGYVLQVHSLSDKPIECRMSAYNDSRNEKVENRVFIVQPGETQELGMLELNWQFVPGEHGWVSVSGYLMKLNFELKSGGGWKVW